MSQTSNTAIAVIGIDIGKNSFDVVGHDTITNASVPAHIQAAHRGIEFIERFTGRPIGVQLLLPGGSQNERLWNVRSSGYESFLTQTSTLHLLASFVRNRASGNSGKNELEPGTH